MSSILKALKKIDEESPPTPTVPSLPKSVDPKSSIGSRIGKHLHLPQPKSTLLILAIVVGIGVLLLSQKQLILAKLFPPKISVSDTSESSTSDAKPKAFQSKKTIKSLKSTIPSPIKSPQTRKQPKKMASKRKNNTKKTDIRTYQPPANTREKISKKPFVAKMPEAKTSSIIPKPDPRQSVSKNLPTARKPTFPGNKRSIYSAPQTLKSERGQERAQYSRLGDSKLKLQALAWSADAAQRMVVINGRIVREGESVDGYQITQIRKEDVLVNDGGKSWRLEFELR